MKKDFISLEKFSAAEISEIWSMSQTMKRSGSASYQIMKNKTAALIFEKPSLRTRVSFEVGIAQLGGASIFLSQQNIGLSTRESVEDIAEVLSRYSNLIIARTLQHRTVEDLAAAASIPVINALTDLLHPCQILADAFTLREHDLFSGKIVFIGDGNNVANSWLELAGKFPLNFVLACPPGYEPDPSILGKARAAGLSRIEILHDPLEAAKDADVLYTDVWVSMGQEAEMSKRMEDFSRFQVNDDVISAARPHCAIMHCLPARRGEEITASAFNSPRSIIMEQAENRLHVQKGIIMYLMNSRRLQKTNHDAITFSQTL